ncbi:MAG TPA: hypothetical protein VLC48_04700, partial [Gemmatimonadota bacterium]|nr:hypothetical protein [Gemmatimonadota bacterium]
GDVGVCLYCSNTFLALAFDGAGMADSAVAYYERSISTYEQYRRIGDALADGFFLPDAYERLGMLYEERGDREKAIYYYGLLAELWKDADPELKPRVEAARRAIAALSTDR